MNSTINGRTPEEIKKGLECCKPKWESGRWVSCSGECPFRNEGAYCRNVLLKDNIAYIQQLEAERDQYKRERDAAVADMTELMKNSELCTFCKHYVGDEDCCSKPPLSIFDKAICWQWRGVEVE